MRKIFSLVAGRHQRVLTSVDLVPPEVGTEEIWEWCSALTEIDLTLETVIGISPSFGIVFVGQEEEAIRNRDAARWGSL